MKQGLTRVTFAITVADVSLNRAAPDATTRFSSRVEDYVRYRPRYPAALYAFLASDLGVGAESVVADVGCGTGIFAEPLLRGGAVVFGLEPNAEMRAAAERILATYPDFRSVSASAEATTLPDHSVDLVACAQAFHWFDAPQAAAEFGRIAKPGGAVALVWNRRPPATSGFLAEYESLLVTYGTDYQKVSREHRPMSQADFENVFGFRFERRIFANSQSLDLAGLRGRILSASYTPAPGQPGHAELLAALTPMFDRFQVGGRVTLPYDTELYFGHVR